MKNNSYHYTFLLVISLLCTLFISTSFASEQSDCVLWYTQPAQDWNEALPVGNGHLGAMVFGGVPEERIQLNDDTLWDGYPRDRTNPEALEALPKVRELLFAGKNKEAEALASNTMMGIPERILSYQSLGDLSITMHHAVPVAHYKRSLNLDTAIATTRYSVNKITYTRSVFASVPHNVIVMQIEADQPGAISCDISLSREQDITSNEANGNMITMHGQINRPHHETGENVGKKFACKVLAKPHGGEMSAEGDTLSVRNATRLTLFISSGTNYKGADALEQSQFVLQTIEGDSFQDIRSEHIDEHQRLFRRVSLDLGSSPQRDLPTDLRLEAVQNGANDPGLVALYFQFGRYLLISSSRPGCMPANLQGLWNPHMNAPWNSDYHTNINLQMNYWPAEVTNLSECHLPLFDLMESLVPSGKDTAKKHYGARGWVVHHLTDVWGFTVPADGVWGIWPVGAAWLCQHPYEHFLFTGDEEFLRETGYPLMKEGALFMLDFLVESPEGWLVTNPSHSPENSFLKEDGTKSMFTYAATMDLEIIHDLFNNCIEASRILTIDEEFRSQLASALARLAPLQISDSGRLQEWIKDYDEPEPGHRHISHLYGLHPGRMITPNETPELAAAAQKSLEYRLSHGGGHTGWSRAWIINHWARLKNAEKAYENVQALLAKSTLKNLFDTHPPFQIDGNFGGTAGVAEMLIQSHENAIELLPALPDEWATGSVEGLCARGGFVIDMKWTDKELSRAKILSRAGSVLRLRYDEPISIISNGEVVAARVTEPGVLEFDTNPQQIYILSTQESE